MSLVSMASSYRVVRTIGVYKNAVTIKLATKIFRHLSCSGIQAEADQKHDSINRHNLPLPDDKLILRGMMFHGFHGAYKEEKQLSQKFLVDIDVWLNLRKAGETDDLNDSVSYAEIYRVVKGIVEGPSHVC